MKLIINYDVVERIYTANNGIPLKDLLKQAIPIQSSVFAINCIIDFITFDGKIEVLQNSLLFISGLAGVTTAAYMFKKTKEEEIKNDACSDLRILANKLNNLKINTDADLLKKAQVSETKYRMVLNKQKRPTIQQDKYISIPTYDWQGNIKETSILQEHTIGSNEYILSIGSPQKSLKLSLANSRA